MIHETQEITDRSKKENICYIAETYAEIYWNCIFEGTTGI
jgi:hypothetical protein